MNTYFSFSIINHHLYSFSQRKRSKICSIRYFKYIHISRMINTRMLIHQAPKRIRTTLAALRATSADLERVCSTPTTYIHLHCELICITASLRMLCSLTPSLETITLKHFPSRIIMKIYVEFSQRYFAKLCKMMRLDNI